MSLNLDKSGWTRVAFGDVIESITERVDHPSETGVDRYVGLAHLDPSVMVVQRWDSPDKVEAQKLRFYPGDVIFGRRRAYQKKVAMAEFEGICSAHALVLRAKPGRMHPSFLPVFLSSDYFLDRAISISVGSLSPTVNWRDLKAEQFVLPPLDEQERLADLLWAVEREALAKRRQQLAVRWIAQLLADDLVWKSCASMAGLGELLVSCKYGTSERCVSDFTNKSTPVLRIPNVLDGELSLHDLKYLPEPRDESDPAAVEPGDFLVVRTNGNPAYVSRGVLVPELDRTFLAASYLLRLRARPDRLLPEYLALAWETPTMKGALASFIRSSAGNYNLSASSVLAQSIPIPPLDEQSAIVRQARQISSAAGAVAVSIASLTSMRSALVVDIFGGAS